jgi:7,8-dihydro-6-hydroxymethylpterin-pyrophosphokinase
MIFSIIIFFKNNQSNNQPLFLPKMVMKARKFLLAA